MKIGVCDWRCVSHMSENVDSFGHAKTKDAKEKLKQEKFWVALELFKVHNRRHHDPPKYDTKEIESFIVDKLAQQLCNMVMTQYSMFFFWGGGYCKLMTLDLLHKEVMRSHIDLASARCHM